MSNQRFDTSSKTGFRHFSEMTLFVSELAKQFDGLGPDRSRGRVLAAFKRAAPPLGISPRLRDTVDLLMMYSQDKDWQKDQRPIVWPSNQRLQDELCLGRRQVQYILRELMKLRLIAPVDSPTGKRWGRRDRDGYITEAYGFDLSPLAQRFDEFKAIAERAQAERAERGRLRRRLTIAKKATVQIVTTALEEGIPGTEWETVGAKALDLVNRAAGLDAVAALSPLVEALENLRADAEIVFRDGVLSVDNPPEGAIDCAHITSTNDLKFDKSNTVVNTKKNSQQNTRSTSPLARERDPKSLDTFDPIEQKLAKYQITPELIRFVSPFFAEMLGAENQEPDWNDVFVAADRTKQLLGISDHAWAEGIQVMGRPGAAVAIAIITAKRKRISSPGGYFRGMIGRAKVGELNLGPSVYALRDERAGKKL